MLIYRSRVLTWGWGWVGGPGSHLQQDNPDRRVPAGVQCRTCERMDCRQRAFPPVYHRLNIDENVRGLSAYVSTTSGR